MNRPDPLRHSVGYCTNVHAGTDLASIRANLLRYAVPIREKLERADRLGVGLWIPAQAAAEIADDGAARFADFLSEHQLQPFTFNAFPYDNFHQDTVKHRVYSPPWWESARLEYTERLAGVLAAILPENEPCGSISTLPIGWPANPHDTDTDAMPRRLQRAADNFRSLAETLARIEAESGRRIVVAIEPEPGCILDTADDVIAWFDRHLPDPNQRRYLTVCHDICHSAVMMEDQADVLRRYADAGIGVGKVQVSSAVVVNWDAMSADRRREAAEQLAAFAEDRYLHQTGRRTAAGEFVLEEDLPGCLNRDGGGDPAGDDTKWVVHFHVPVFLERFGHLTTSQADIESCLRTLADPKLSLEFTGHLEIETYAWTVLPESMRRKGLAEDIAQEFRWLGRQLNPLKESLP